MISNDFGYKSVEQFQLIPNGNNANGYLLTFLIIEEMTSVWKYSGIGKKSFYRINHHSMINPRFYVDGKRLFVRNVPPLKVRGKRAPWLRLFVRKCRWWTISEECLSTTSLFPRQKERKEKKKLSFLHDKLTQKKKVKAWGKGLLKCLPFCQYCQANIHKIRKHIFKHR